MRTFQLLATLLTALMLSSCQKSRLDNRFTEEIRARLAQAEGVFAVAVKDLRTGQTLLINEHEQFHAASTMKLPVMVEVFKQSAAGKFALDDSLAIKNEFRSIVDSSTFSLNAADDSELSLYQHIGEGHPISALLYQMIISSSNLATNLIIELVDARNVNATMRELGINDVLVLRGVEDIKAYRQGLNNTTSAYGLMVMLEKIARKEMVSKDASEAMIDILLDQRFREIIPANLPPDARVAHKTGNISGVRHDAGIVFIPNGGEYVIVLLSKELTDEQSGIAAMADVSQLIYEQLTK